MIIPWRFFIARARFCRALRWSAGLLLYGWRSWDVNGSQMVSSWSQNIDMLEKAPNVASRGFLSRYGIFILFTRKVASRVKSDRLKAMLCSRVVLWENSKAGRVARWLWAVGWLGGCG